MAEAYTGFASVYDMFMDDIPYEEWCAYVCELLSEYKITSGIVLDLGCGTGKFTELMAGQGYDMIGVDIAEEMLSIAMERKAASGRDILYLLQDMREFELYGTVAAVVSICDSMNYITGDEELLQVFRLVNNYLDPGGLFIFDLNTVHKYRDLLGESVIAENREDGSFIWENFYDPESRMNEYDLTLFIKADADGGHDTVQESCNIYQKYEETHYQRAYSLEEIRSLLKQAGMQFVTAYDAFTHNPVQDESERIYVIAQECGKRKSEDQEDGKN